MRLVIKNFYFKAFETNEELRKASEMWCLERVLRHVAWCKYGHVSYWETGKVTDMNDLFAIEFGGFRTEDLNDNIENWGVTEMMGMFFYSASKFNQPLAKWNISKVKLLGDMKDMFLNAYISNYMPKWSISKRLDAWAPLYKPKKEKKVIQTITTRVTRSKAKIDSS